MTNPLFLTLYCKTYNGEEVCLPVLYERLIEKISDNVFNALKLHLKGYSEGTDFLRPLIYQVAANMINNEHRAISKDDLLKLDYWKEYGLVPAQLISQLIKEDFFHDYAFDDKEYYYFAYDQMNDYYCAKALLNTHSNSIDFRGYLTKQVLKIENGELKNYGDIDLFVNACALYADKFGEECIDIIDALDNDNDKWDVFSRYIKSFQWRDARHIGSELLYDLLKKYPCSPEELWPMLIGNSLKTSHPLNAEFLHEFLSKYELNKRDYLWTIYINSLTLDDENRIVQLIELYDRGEKLEATSDKQIELLLILFGWLLTSSNRWLRDYTSFPDRCSWRTPA